jgi:hypothetical protein
MSLPETLSPRRSTNGKSTQKDLEHTLERHTPYGYAHDRRA